jgi:hypothetical protein
LVLSSAGLADADLLFVEGAPPESLLEQPERAAAEPEAIARHFTEAGSRSNDAFPRHLHAVIGAHVIQGRRGRGADGAPACAPAFARIVLRFAGPRDRTSGDLAASLFSARGRIGNYSGGNLLNPRRRPRAWIQAAVRQ